VFTSLPPNVQFSCKVEEIVNGLVTSTSRPVILTTAPAVLRAQPDVFKLWGNTPTRLDVLHNDWVSLGGVADRISSFTQPAHGTLSLITVGGEVQQLLYTPTTGYVGTDSFTYQAQDSRDGITAPSTTVVLTVLAPFVLPTSSGAALSTALAIDGAGTMDVNLTSTGVANGATQPGFSVTGYSRSAASSSGVTARTVGRTLVSEISAVGDQLVFDQGEPSTSGTLEARSYRQSATPAGDIVLEPIGKSAALPESRLVSTLGDMLFTPARRVPYAPFWGTYSPAIASAYVDAAVLSSDALPDAPAKYLQEMLSSHALGTAPQSTSFATLPAGSVALGATGDFSASDVMIGDGAKRVGLIAQLQSHTAYSNRLQSPEMIGSLNRLVSGFSLISSTWSAVPALAATKLDWAQQELMKAYRTYGHRRAFANIARYVREVDTAALDTTTQSIRMRLLGEISADEYFTLSAGPIPAAPLSDMSSIARAGIAADQVAMHLLKVGIGNELLKQLTDADAAKLLLQDLMVEMLAQGPYSANFLRYLPSMKVYTQEWVPAQSKYRTVVSTGATRYAQLLGIGRNQ